jgi:hypothetical protein
VDGGQVFSTAGTSATASFVGTRTACRTARTRWA